MSDMRNDFEEMIRQEVDSDREYKIALRRVAGDYAHNGMQQRFEDFCCGVESTESRITQLETELAAALAQANVNEQSQAQQPTNVWQQAIDDELINAHLGIAHNEVTREEAKAELNKLIEWHIDVAKYFDSQAQQTESNLWRIERDYDMGKVYDSSGKFIAMTYGKDAQKFVDAHNSICVSQSPAPMNEVNKPEGEKP